MLNRSETPTANVSLKRQMQCRIAMIPSRQHAGKRPWIGFPMRLYGDISGDKDPRRSQVGFVSLSECRKAGKCDTLQAMPLHLWGKTRGNVACSRPVEARHVPEFWVHSRCVPGLPPTLIGKFDENATHLSLRNGVGNGCMSAVNLAAGTSANASRMDTRVDLSTPSWEARR
jgi:hypothetical protein